MFRHFTWYVYNLDEPLESPNLEIGTYWDGGMWPFCSGHAFLPDGRLLITGGDHSYYNNPDGYPIKTESVPPSVFQYAAEPWASVFDPAGNEYEAVANMQPGSARWYPTNVTMPDGSVWVVSGNYWEDVNENGIIDDGGYNQEKPWLRWADGAWGTVHSDPLEGRATFPLYPYFHVMPSGLYYSGAQHHEDIKASCEACDSRFWEWSNVWPVFVPSARQLDDHFWNHDHGTSVLLTLAPPYFSEEPGGQGVERVLFMGGGDNSAIYPDTTGVRGPHRGAEVFEPHESPPWRVIEPMLHARKELSGTLLPDGKVLASGGHYVQNPCFVSPCDPDFQNLENSPVLECEMFDPATETWSEMASLGFSYGRKYHSFALLLPDGRVLTAGNQQQNGEEGAGHNYEIFYPPYLFKAGGGGSVLLSSAERPSIATWASTIEYGFPFLVQVNGDEGLIDEVCLIAPSAATHGNNMTQRRVKLDFEKVTIGSVDHLACTAPWEPEIAPPGDYLLFVLDGGVPSVAQWVRLQQPADYVVPTGQSETWYGKVHLDRDFTIQPGGTLTILPGTEVFARAKVDSTNGGLGDGKYLNRVEIVNEGGRLIAQGTVSEPITFTSHLGASPPLVDEWGGIRSRLTGCLCTGYGYSTGVGPPSVIEHATIANAKAGVAIETPLAPNLRNITFMNIEGDRHIYADGTDVVIPKGYWTGGCEIGTEVAEPGVWDLKGETHVVFSNATTTDLACVGVPGKADLMVDGLLLTDESEPGAGDYVYFKPETPTSESSIDAGKDWGGIFMSFYSSGSSIRYADIGYAANPIYLYYPTATPSLTKSRIHHFADVGVWIHQTYGPTGPILDELLVERSPGLYPELGEVGVFFDRADGSKLLNSEISLEGRNSTYPATGVSAYFTSAFCAAPTGAYQAFDIDNNCIKGPGVDGVGTSDAGISATWLCGAALRPVYIRQNAIHGWQKAGIYLSQPENLPVAGNAITDGFNGIDINRGSTVTTPGVRLRGNRVEATASVATYYAFRTNDANYTKLGPDDSNLGTGVNQLAVHVQDTKFIYEDDADLTDELDATANYWFTYTATPPTFTQIGEGEDVEISNRIVAPLGPPVNFEDFKTTAPSGSIPSCPTPPGTTPWVLVDGRITSRSTMPVSGETSAPAVVSLGPARPNPVAGRISIDLAVPPDRVGEYRFEVFDVRGRRVFHETSAIEHAGRFALSWSGTDTRGSVASTGIYFLRVSGPSGFVATRKVVRVQ